MLVTHKFKMELNRRGTMPVIEAVQGDENVRVVEITLTSNYQPWPVPKDASALVRFRKSDGTGGIYDTLEDGSAAITVAGNVLTVKLAGQVLTAPGLVAAQVELNKEDQTLSTFAFGILVQADPSIGAMASKDYYNLSQYVSKEIAEKLSELDFSSGVCYVTATQAADGVVGTTDKTYETLKLAYDAGQVIICAIIDNQGSHMGCAPMLYYSTGNPDIFLMEGFYCSMAGVRYVAVEEVPFIATADISSVDSRNQCTVAIKDLSVSSGGVDFQTDATLKLENGILSVNTADKPEQDNTLPITSAAVHEQLGNIEALLATI